ncbi:uncharacterized protein KD926_007186 [Aspergillus affinis]|uniref:uncharacterized protein n=1 Tax=Aspergillus affinis TaxID=1070780 RepID=UPI0022FEECD6|nr:uncharacterized protein KD926_007186 [Aspergillus affinis]KAI9041232.1 hypothetical protein KD926_007186 [Aspergillus affinis]
MAFTMNKFLALLAIWFLIVGTVVGDSMKELDNDRDVLERAVYLESGLLPRDGSLTVTVTDTVCATRDTGVPTTLITAPHAPTATLTSVNPPALTTPCPPESKGDHTTATARPEPSSMSIPEHLTGISVPVISTSTVVSSGAHPSTHVGSQTTGPTLPSSSPATSAGHPGSHSASTQTTGSASSGTAPSSSHSSTAPPLSNDAFAQGGMQGALVALALTFVGFLAV